MLKPTASISIVTEDIGLGDGPEDRLIISCLWEGPGLDRKDGIGVALGKPTPKARALAERLARAINAGAAYPNPHLATDVRGRTYVGHDHAVRGRALNADLRRLGF